MPMRETSGCGRALLTAGLLFSRLSQPRIHGVWENMAELGTVGTVETVGTVARGHRATLSYISEAADDRQSVQSSVASPGAYSAYGDGPSGFGERPSAHGGRRRNTTKHRVTLPLIDAAAHMAGRSHGTRRLHLRLRVPQWEGIDSEGKVLPPAKNLAPSNAAVLFDIAYAASLAHHAHVLTLTRATWATSYATTLFISTAVPTVCQWWAISLFLCRYDSGDLVNEWFLVVYMILVVGQSLTIQDCANCLLSQNFNQTCTLSPDPGSGFYLERLRCSSRGHHDAGEASSNAPWPLLPLQCWTYILVSLAPRVIHLGNACRAVRDVQPDGKRDAQLQVVEQALVLTLWLAGVCQDTVAPAAALVACAACAELLLLVTEPLRRLHRALEARGQLATRLIEIPIDVSYAEKRWQRLLMIALAMLPNFRALVDGADADDGLIGLVRVGFMVVSCALAYIIKVYYFDLVDDHEMMEMLRRCNLHKVWWLREMMTRTPAHACVHAC